jgi:uncharacterized protein YkwD
MPRPFRHLPYVSAALILFSYLAFGQPAASSGERALLDAVNAERRAQDEPPLIWDDALAAAARSHAAQMARHDMVTHVVPGEPTLPSRAARAGAKFSWISENVVAASSAASAHAQFMKSPAHRANILDMDMDRIGIGIVERGSQVFVVEDFVEGK